MACTLAIGFVFGGFLFYLSTAEALFDDLYQAGDLFAVYFAVLALGMSSAFFINSRLVMQYGMFRMSVAALIVLFVTSGTLMNIAVRYEGDPPFLVFMVSCLVMFMCFGILFGNLNAMAMEVLGRIAGLGASIVASISSLLAVIFAVLAGRFYDGTALPLATGFMVASALALALVFASRRSATGDV